MDSKTLWATMSITPDFWKIATLADKRIVIRNAAIIVKSYDYALVVCRILGRVCTQVTSGRCLAITQGEVKIAILIEGNQTDPDMLYNVLKQMLLLV